jgi:hypothetical protein
VRNALIALLDEVYDRERALALDRVHLIFREPALMAAAEHNSRVMRDAFADVFVARGALPQFDARVSAAVATALLTVAIDQWQRQDGTRPLADLIAATFDVMGGAP